MTESKPVSRAQELFEIADELKDENPISWAIVRGRSHIGKIGVLLGKTPSQLQKLINWELDKKRIRRHPKYNHLLLLDPSHESYKVNMEMKTLFDKVEGKWLDEFPEMAKTLMISNSALQVWKEANPELAPKPKIHRFNSSLTNKQAETLVSLEQWADGSTFTPMAVARAQGYTQAGWTKRGLEILGERGYIKKIRLSPATYRLTERGIEVLKEAKTQGIQPKKREGSDLDLGDL